MGDTSVSQIIVEVLGGPDVSPDVSVSQIIVEVLGATGTGLCWTACLGKSFLYTAANWEASTVWFLEVYLKAVSGTVYARLYDETDSVAVTGVQVSTASASYTRLRSGSFTNLIDGHLYCAQFGATTGGDTGAGIGARLINI